MRIRNQLLRYLIKENSPWQLVRDVDADPLTIINEIKTMQADGLVEIRDGNIFLTQDGDKARKQSHIQSYPVRCEHCDGHGIADDPFGILPKFKKIVEKRPKPVPDYDQGYIRELDIIRRVSFIYERGDLENANIIVIGDDDLISIAMAITGMPNQIKVMEIDDRLIDFINKVAREHNLNIQAQKFDIRYDIPEQFLGKYDIFITDPVETVPGITLFLSRAASALHSDGSGYFGLTHIEASLKKWVKIERILLDMNFVITDMLRDFSVYPMHNNLEISENKYLIKRKIKELLGNGKIDADFYRSTLIRIEAIGNPNPLIVGERKLKDEIYIDGESIVTAMATKVL